MSYHVLRGPAPDIGLMGITELRSLNTTHSLLLVLLEVQRDTIHAVPLIDRVPKLFPLEHMPQVAAAIGAHNLGARHKHRLVLVSLDGAGDRVEKGGPAAARVELCFRGVERGVACGAVWVLAASMPMMG